MPNIKDLFKRKSTTVEFFLKNQECKELLEDFITNDLPGTACIIIAFEDKNKRAYWRSAGIEPAQAILILDQLHHRVQHEGLKDYD